MPEFVFTRRALLALVVTGVVGVLAVHPTWAKSIGADVWNVAALKDELRATQLDNARLECEDEQVRYRIALKESLIKDLIAERATLADVSGQFATLDATRPAYMDVLRKAYPGGTDQEVVARNVIAYTLARVAPGDRATVSSRLEADLRKMLSSPAH